MALNEKCLERCPDIHRRSVDVDERVAAAATSDPNSDKKYLKHSRAITHAGCMLLDAITSSMNCPGPKEIPGDPLQSTTPSYACSAQKSSNGIR